MREPIAVTGVGAASAFGLGRAALARGLASGECGFGPLSLFPGDGFRVTRVAEIRAALPAGERVLGALAGRLSRCDRIGLFAAAEAMADAGAHAVSPDRLGVVFGAGAGGMLEAEAYFERFFRAPPPSGTKRWPGLPRRHVLASQLPNATADWVALAFGVLGPRATIATACSSSATALGYAADLLHAGAADAVLAGGAEALSRVTLAGFNALRAIDAAGPRPFDVRRQGMGLGEGAGVLVLERLSSARARGAHVRALLLGYGLSADAFHMTNPHPEGSGALAAMRAALTDAGVAPPAVDHVNAHGTGTPANDSVEAAAIRALLGASEAGVAVCSVKGAIGHTLGAAGALEAAATVISIEEGFVPPTIGLCEPDPACGALDMVRGAPRRRDVRLALSNSFAFGGNNTALLFGKAG